MEATFNQQRAGVVAATRIRISIGRTKAAKVAHTDAILVTSINDDVFRAAQQTGQSQITGLNAGQQQRLSALVHGMQVKQPVRLAHKSLQGRCTVALQRAPFGYALR